MMMSFLERIKELVRELDVSAHLRKIYDKLENIAKNLEKANFSPQRRKSQRRHSSRRRVVRRSRSRGLSNSNTLYG